MVMRTWRKRNPYILLVEMSISAATLEIRMEGPQEIKREPPYGPDVPLLGYIKKNVSQHAVDLHVLIISALVTVAKLWNQPRCPATTDWTKQMWCVYTTDCYSAIKKNEIMLLAGK
jgi:hypothetical protein